MFPANLLSQSPLYQGMFRPPSVPNQTPGTLSPPGGGGLPPGGPAAAALLMDSLLRERQQQLLAATSGAYMGGPRPGNLLHTSTALQAHHNQLLASQVAMLNDLRNGGRYDPGSRSPSPGSSPGSPRPERHTLRSGTPSPPPLKRELSRTPPDHLAPLYAGEKRLSPMQSRTVLDSQRGRPEEEDEVSSRSASSSAPFLKFGVSAILSSSISPKAVASAGELRYY